jgi:hypothetical protein
MFVALFGALGQTLLVLENLLDYGLVPDDWRPWISLVIAALTVLGVERFKNIPVTPRPDPGRLSA